MEDEQHKKSLEVTIATTKADLYREQAKLMKL